jgi:hypothetical protein
MKSKYIIAVLMLISTGLTLAQTENTKVCGRIDKFKAQNNGLYISINRRPIIIEGTPGIVVATQAKFSERDICVEGKGNFLTTTTVSIY